MTNACSFEDVKLLTLNVKQEIFDRMPVSQFLQGPESRQGPDSRSGTN